MIQISKIFTLTLLCLSIRSSLLGQTFVPVSSDDPIISGILSTGEIVVRNEANDDVRVRCSYDKVSWVTKVLVKGQLYSLKLPREVENLYVEICQRAESSNLVNCDIYRSVPKMRYVLKYNHSKQRLEYRKAMNDN